MWRRLLAGALTIFMAAGSIVYAAPEGKTSPNVEKDMESVQDTLLNDGVQSERSLDFNRDWSFQLGDDSQAMTGVLSRILPMRFSRRSATFLGALAGIENPLYCRGTWRTNG